MPRSMIAGREAPAETAGPTVRRTPGRTPQRLRGSRRSRGRRGLLPLVLLAPALLGLVLFRLGPMVGSVLESFYAVSFAGGAQKVFVGLGNYLDILQDPTFRTSLRVTVTYNLIVNPLVVALALGLAVLARLPIRGRSVYRMLYLVPIGASVTIACVLWRVILDPAQGLLNGLLRALGLPAQPFLTSREQALICVVVIVAWSSISLWSLFLRSGLDNLPQEVTEAAIIDGAGVVSRFVHVTLPMLRPMLLFVLVVNTSANFLIFSPMYVLTFGGPELSTHMIMYEAFRTTYVYLDSGRAMAMIVVLVPIIALSVLVQFKALSRREA